MVDFKLLAKKMYEESTPEQRARIDAYRAREARLDTTRREIDATFTYFGERMVEVPGKSKAQYETYPLRSENKAIEMRIEDGIDHKGEAYEVIHFIGATTGHESFRLNEDLIKTLTKDRDQPEHRIWSICAGSARYARCEISTDDVISYLKELRPNLFEVDVAPRL